MGPRSEGGEKNPKGGGIGSLIAAIGLVTALAGASGFLGGQQLRALLPAEKPAAQRMTPARVEGEALQVLTLPAIVTNLAGSEKSWVRLEAAVLIEGKRAVAADLAARLAQDITALLRTLSVRQISGASGFQHLREELLDRLRLRSADRIRDIMIQSLVIE